MSLVAGRGPLSQDPAGWFSPPLPADVVFVEPHPRRVQAISHGHTVIDTERALLVHRRNRPLAMHSRWTRSAICRASLSPKRPDM